MNRIGSPLENYETYIHVPVEKTFNQCILPGFTYGAETLKINAHKMYELINTHRYLHLMKMSMCVSIRDTIPNDRLIYVSVAMGAIQYITTLK